MIGTGRTVASRPDYGPEWADLRCSVCGAGWVGIDGDPCGWCERSLERLLTDTRAELLAPHWLAVDHGPRYDDLTDDSKLVWDRTRGVSGEGAATTWAERLGRAVKAGLVTEDEARRALERWSNVA